MDAPPTQHDHAPDVPRKRRRRGRDHDGRTREALRARALLADFTQACPLPSTGARQARLTALVGITMALERIAHQQARGEHVDPAEIVALTNSQGRLMGELGIAPQAPEPEKPDPLAEHRKRMGWDQ